MKQCIASTAGLILVLCSAVSVQAKQVQISPPPSVKFESGVLYWQSMGKFREIVNPSRVVSQLTFDNMNSRSVELVTRLDINRLFGRMSIGIGSISSGQEYDEDWYWYNHGAPPYGKTLSQINGVTNSITVDVGRIVLKDEDKTIAQFIGYSYYNQKVDLLGCFQMVESFRPCLGASDSRLTQTESVAWKSLRVGVIAEKRMHEHFKISGEVVPMYLTLSERDNHLLRSYTTWFNGRGYGYGLQIEATAKYLVTDTFNISVGWRYWLSKAWGDGNCTSNGYGGCYEKSADHITIPTGAEKFSAQLNGFIVQFTGRF